MIRVMFICHGNICRSPMAEFLFRDMVRKAGREDEFLIDSAAVSREEIGNPVYPPVRRLLEADGISCENKRARQVTPEDYRRFDFLICMDRSNIRNLKALLGGDPSDKIRLLLSYAGSHDSVSDPWYTRAFEAARRDILRGCRGLLSQFPPSVESLRKELFS